jgi:hypothetical protein
MAEVNRDCIKQLQDNYMNQLNRKVKSQVGRLKWWQVALISLVVSFVGKLTGGLDAERQKKNVADLKQAPWSPPDWLFAPAWTINNFFLLLGLQRILTSDRITEIAYPLRSF